ncbi:MAG: LamG domain-containing protein [Opitutaceae bacterium]|nr:LamG domain-containing protein [Opitutaceae bacterium]
MKQIRNTSLAAVLLALLASATATRAGLIANYPFDYADKGTAEAGQILDKAGEPPSDAVKRINWPEWCTQTRTGVPVPVNPHLGAPADGRALCLRKSHGHDFGTGAKEHLKFSNGPFSIFIRLFYSSSADLRFIRSGTLEIRFFTEKHGASAGEKLAASIIVNGQKLTVWANPGEPGQWHDYVITVQPGGQIAAWVDGKIARQRNLPNTPADPGEAGFRYENYNATPQYIESLRIYDHALTADEVAALSGEVQPSR